MKRIICLTLAFAMLLFLFIPVRAEENENEYEIVTMGVEYSDSIGNLEELTFMMNDGNLYVSAKGLASGLGYEVSVGETGVYFENDTNQELTYETAVFLFDNTKVMRTISKKTEPIEGYEAPFCSIKNGNDAWIPFRYALFVLGSAVSVVDGTYCIDIPDLTIPDVFYLVAKNSDKYRFDWYDDFGYSDFDISTMGVSSHIVNMVNGLLEFDGDSWAEFFQIYATDESAYDRKYGENLAILFCTQSDEELNAEVKRLKKMTDFINPDGKLGSFLSKGAEIIDQNVGTMQKSCDELLSMAKAGNASWSGYNKMYQALEKALDYQSWYGDTSELIMHTQEGLKGTIPYLKTLATAMEVAGYAEEFQHQDDFSIAALKASLEDLSEEAYTSEVMRPSMLSYIKRLESDILSYSATRWLEENIDGFIKSAGGISKAIGSQAGFILAAWDLMSNYVPQIKDGLNATDKFELALYSSVFCSDVYKNYLEQGAEVFSNEERITAENLYKMSQACYTYLKTCLITRDAALASITTTSDYKNGNLNQLIEYQNQINEEISDLLIILKDGNLTNEDYVYGFLPDDNKKYLTAYDDSDLIAVFEEEMKESSLITPERAYAAYENIVKEYQAACAVESSEWFANRSEYLNQYPDLSAYILDNYHTSIHDSEDSGDIPYEIAYMYFDVDQNGIPELFMIEGYHEANIFAVFTFDGNQAVNLNLAQPEEFGAYFIYNDGVIGVFGGPDNGYETQYFLLESDGYTVKSIVLTDEERNVRREREVLITRDDFTILGTDVGAENNETDFNSSETRKDMENVVYFLTSDYDGNGTEETFFITGTFDGVNGYMDVEIRFLDSNGIETCVCSMTPQGDPLYGYLNSKDGELKGNETNDYLITAGNFKFLAWEISAYGSASTSLIFGVKDGKPYELDISGKYMGFHQDKMGQYIAMTSDFSQGYHDYIERVFIFDEKIKQFILY